jgi:mannose-6-phosphate isomerase-like protein (cupin superfamily)
MEGSMKRIWIAGALAALTVGAAAMVAATAQTPAKTGELRRVVTKLDESGKAVVMSDDSIPLLASRSPNGVGEIWVTTKSPARLSFIDDLAHIKTGVQPPRNGTVFRVVDFPPITEEIEKRPVDMLQKIVGAENTPGKGQPPKHPYMHRTRSVDYAIVLSGEIEMMLDNQTLALKAGDIVVQQATNHAWINRSKGLARVAFVLMDSEEP